MSSKQKNGADNAAHIYRCYQEVSLSYFRQTKTLATTAAMEQKVKKKTRWREREREKNS